MSLPAEDLIAEEARQTPGLVVVALGPMTNLGDLASSRPKDYARLAGVHAMAGSLNNTLVEGAAEWNVAADPESMATLLQGSAPLTIVPDDAVPYDTPAALHGPVVGQIADAMGYDQWWDLATAAALVVPHVGKMTTSRWMLDDKVPGRLRRVGPGPVRVYKSLDGDVLGDAYADVFAPCGPLGDGRRGQTFPTAAGSFSAVVARDS